MSELSKLMVKAVRSLPPEEQDALLEAMLEPRLAPWPAPGEPVLPAAELLPGRAQTHQFLGHDPRVGLGFALPPLGPETGGPWQSVPVRLSTDQHERLKQWCQINGFTMAVVLRGLVARFLDDQATRRPARGEPTSPPATPSPGQPSTPPSGRAATAPLAPEPPAGGQPESSPSATEPPGAGA
jgi:hypothetical protein